MSCVPLLQTSYSKIIFKIYQQFFEARFGYICKFYFSFC